MPIRKHFVGQLQSTGGKPQSVNLYVNELPNTESTTFISGDATPSVADGDVFITTGTTNITDFDDGIIGQTIRILAGGTITVEDSPAIILNGSANYAMTANDTLTLTMFNDQVWNEVARSVN